MKKYQTIILALICTLFASCMGEDYAEPNLSESPYGNNELTESGYRHWQRHRRQYLQ